MELSEILERVKKIKQAYNILNRTEGFKIWGASEYLHGLEGDVGDLAKLYLAKKGFAFSQKETDKKLAQELADCFWSVLVLAEELDIDLETEFDKTLKKLEDKIQDRGVKRTAGKKLV